MNFVFSILISLLFAACASKGTDSANPTEVLLEREPATINLGQFRIQCSNMSYHVDRGAVSANGYGLGTDQIRKWLRCGTEELSDSFKFSCVGEDTYWHEQKQSVYISKKDFKEFARTYMVGKKPLGREFMTVEAGVTVERDTSYSPGTMPCALKSPK